LIQTGSRVSENFQASKNPEWKQVAIIQFFFRLTKSNINFFIRVINFKPGIGQGGCPLSIGERHAFYFSKLSHYFRSMIQRIQTVFLLLATLVSASLLYFPLFELPAMAPDPAPREFMITSSALLLILNAAIGVFSFVVIFLFKNRSLQLKACRLVLILIFIMIGLLFYTSDTLSNGLDQKVIFKIGTYLPLLQVIFVFLAHRGIKKDDELVRSADRLR